LNKNDVLYCAESPDSLHGDPKAVNR